MRLTKKTKRHFYSNLKLISKSNHIINLNIFNDRTASDPNSQNIIQKMYDIMGKHYDQIKEEVGLKDAFEKSDEEEEQTEAIFKKLRPKSKYKFSDVI